MQQLVCQLKRRVDGSTRHATCSLASFRCTCKQARKQTHSVYANIQTPGTHTPQTPACAVHHPRQLKTAAPHTTAAAGTQLCCSFAHTAVHPCFPPQQLLKPIHLYAPAPSLLPPPALTPAPSCHSMQCMAHAEQQCSNNKPTHNTSPANHIPCKPKSLPASSPLFQTHTGTSARKVACSTSTTAANTAGRQWCAHRGMSGH